VAEPINATSLLLAWRDGDAAALQQLIALLEGELHRIARRCMAGERGGHSLQASALVSEAYLRMVDIHRVNWQNRAHFLATAARLMRRILVDHARAKRYQKRGGGAARVTFTEALAVAGNSGIPDLLAVDEAVSALMARDERKGRVVELRVFGGLTVGEIADVLQVSPETVMRDWKAAKAWLQHQLSDATRQRRERAGN
jgi:RNA polymerase sigma factor (TIGR02999 family)